MLKNQYVFAEKMRSKKSHTCQCVTSNYDYNLGIRANDHMIIHEFSLLKSNDTMGLLVRYAMSSDVHIRKAAIGFFTFLIREEILVKADFNKICGKDRIGLLNHVLWPQALKELLQASDLRLTPNALLDLMAGYVGGLDPSPDPEGPEATPPLSPRGPFFRRLESKSEVEFKGEPVPLDSEASAVPYQLLEDPVDRDLELGLTN